MIEKKTVPYEFLVRFNADGTIAGRHIKHLEVLIEGSEILSAKEGDALPVAGGVLLTAALGDVAAGLIVAADQAALRQQAAEAERDTAIGASENSATALASANETIATLTARLDALSAAPKNEPGVTL